MPPLLPSFHCFTCFSLFYEHVWHHLERIPHSLTFMTILHKNGGEFCRKYSVIILCITLTLFCTCIVWACVTCRVKDDPHTDAAQTKTSPSERYHSRNDGMAVAVPSTHIHSNPHTLNTHSLGPCELRENLINCVNHIYLADCCRCYVALVVRTEMINIFITIF